jgi:hypothetical protein
MKRRLNFASLSALVSLLSASAISQRAEAQALDVVTSYTVKRGDTCVSVAISHYGDRKFVDLLHQGNPDMGPAPHVLVEGSTLRLLPKPAPTADARLDFVRNKVEIDAPTPKPGRKDDPLFRGNRVSTRENSAADVLFFSSKGVLKLSEHTLVVILDSSRGGVSNQPRETTLVTGSLRSRLSELAGGKTETINTPSGSVLLGAGETKIDIDEKKTARLSVYKGQATLTAQKKAIKVPENFGSKTEAGKAPSDPLPLPGMPIWSSPPEAIVWVESSPSRARGVFARGKTGPDVAEWHVQVAHDPEFRDLAVDTRVPAKIDSIETKSIASGTTYFRVSAVDNDKFEGPFSEVRKTFAGRLYWAQAPASTGANALPGSGRFQSASDLTCTVDGKPASETVSMYSAHTVQCASLDGTVYPARTVLAMAALPTRREIPKRVLAPAPAPAVTEPTLIVPEIAVGVNSTAPLTFAGGLGLRFPIAGGSLQIGARVGYEPALAKGTTYPPEYGGRETRYSQSVLKVEAPVVARFGKTGFGPTVSFGPIFLVQDADFDLPTGAKQKASSLATGLFGKIGVELPLGPGAAFADVGYRGTSVRQVDFASISLKGGTFDLGYRFLLK